MFNFAFDYTQPFTFWAGLFGGMVLNTATHGADQMMVQRYLSARSQRQAAVALVASGLVILAQFAFFLLIGVSLFVFYQAYPPAGVRLSPDDAFASFIVRYLPVGVKGLVIAAIFAAAMGTLSGSLNSSASTMVNDLYRPISGCTDEGRLLRISRVLTVLWGIVQMTVAFGATRLQDSVVNNALAIASFATGILLGPVPARDPDPASGPAGGPDRHGRRHLRGLLRQVRDRARVALVCPGRLVDGLCGGACREPIPRGSSGARYSPRSPARQRAMNPEDHLLTESRNPRSEAIDTLTAREIVALMSSEDAAVVEAVRAEAGAIARAVEWTADRFRRGGRLIYVGAGTSGRLGVLDASECPPTFGTPPGMVVGLIAGGPPALTRAVEGAEDDAGRGAADIAALAVNDLDIVVGIATSGRTPYVLGAVREARRRGRPRSGSRATGRACWVAKSTWRSLPWSAPRSSRARPG